MVGNYKHCSNAKISRQLFLVCIVFLINLSRYCCNSNYLYGSLGEVGPSFESRPLKDKKKSLNITPSSSHSGSETQLHQHNDDVKRPKLFTFPRKIGRVTLNFTPRQNNNDDDEDDENTKERQKRQNQIIHRSSFHHLHAHHSLHGKYYNPNNDDCLLTMKLDASSSFRLLKLVYFISVAFGGAFMGTLRLLAPLIFARRVLCVIGEHIMDYLTGRYLRTTYKSIEYKYWRPYQIPDAFRSMFRLIVHMFFLIQMGKIMESVIGLHRKPCVMLLDKLEGSACHWWCSLLWIITVIGTGEACGLAMEVYGGPLRIQEDMSTRASKRFTRPRHILHLLKDPDKWINQITTERKNVSREDVKLSFSPDPMLFPATWKPLRALLFISVAKAMASTLSLKSMYRLMRNFLIQQAFTDEWHRVFINEKRIALGACSNICNLIATTTLCIQVTLLDQLSGLLLIPTLLAFIFSTWMNVLICYEKHFARPALHKPVFTQSNRGQNQNRQQQEQRKLIEQQQQIDW